MGDALITLLLTAGFISSIIGPPLLCLGLHEWLSGLPDRRAEKLQAKREHELAIEKEKTKQLELQQKIVEDYK